MLRNAWEDVYRKGAAGGIDRTTVRTFAAGASGYLEDLARDLQQASYTPEPYLGIKMKKDSGGFRQLGLPTVRDKIVQMALKQLLDPILEPLFLNVSYAYRRNKGTYKAIQRVRHLIRAEKKVWLATCDIEQYFDTIDQQQLLSRLGPVIEDAKIIDLIRLSISMARIGDDLKWQEIKAGIPQGNILSPLLSNFYLHALDCHLQEEELGYVRYADDFVLLAATEAQATTALHSCQRFLQEELSLKLHPDSLLRHSKEGFDFLGIHFQGAEVSVTSDKLARLKSGFHKKFRIWREQLHRDYLSYLKLIRGYYGRLVSETVRESLDVALFEALEQQFRMLLKRKAFPRAAIQPGLFHALPLFSEKFHQERKTLLKELVHNIRKRDPQPPPVKDSATHQKQAAQAKIEAKRREYERKAAQARELLISTPGVFIGKSRGQVVVKQHGKTIRSVPIKHLENLTIQSKGVLISSDLLYQCARMKIPMDFLYPQGKPFAKLLYPVSLSGNIGLAQVQAYDNGKGATLAKAFVQGKLSNQINLIKYHSKYLKAQGGEEHMYWKNALSRLDKARKEARQSQGKTLYELRGKLMAAEGRGASAYWQFVKLLLADKVAFPGREHQGATDPVNSALNYGYGILYGRIWEAVTRARLHEGLSYLHAPADGNKPSLIFDLIEEFRTQAVDRPVLTFIRKKGPPTIQQGRLTDDSRRAVAQQVLKRLSRMEQFRQQHLRLQEIILAQARLLAAYLTDREARYRPYIRKW